MALASIIFGGNSRTEMKDPDTGKSIFTIDATIKSSHSSTASITKRELEEGGVINDHMIVDPESVVLEGIVSETPLDTLNALAASSIGAGASLLSKTNGAGAALAAGVFGGALLGAINGQRSVNAYELMVQMQRKRMLFSLVTGLKNYSNMMLTSVVANRAASIGKAMTFTATIEQITFVSSKLISLGEAQMLGGIGASASGSTNLGKQTASSAGSDTSENGSILYKAFGGFF